MEQPPRPPTANSTPEAPSERQPLDWRTLHLWQIQPVRDVLVLLSLFGILWLGYLLSVVTVPILIALALAYLLEPVVARLARISWLNRPAAALILILSLTIAVFVPLTVAVSFGVVQGFQAVERVAHNLGVLRQSVDQPHNEDVYESLPLGAWRKARNYLVSVDQRTQREAKQAEAPEAAPVDGDEAEELPFDRIRRQASAHALVWLRENSERIGQEVGKRVLGAGMGAVTGAITAVVSVGYLIFAVFLTAFFFFFFSSSFGRISEFWKQLVPERHRDRVVYLVGRMDRVTSAFVRGRLTIAMILAGFYAIGYWAIGVPAPLIFGPLVGIVSLAPYISGVLGMPGAMLLMTLSPSGIEWQTTWWWVILAPIGVSLIGQALDDYVLTPIIQGRGADMDMPTILFASIAGGVLGGFYGVLLAIPVAASLKILLTEVVWPRFKDWAEGRSRDPLPISANPPPPLP